MGWVKLEDDKAKDRIIVSVWGKPKTGKTHLALTFPDPLYYFNFDWGFEHHKEGLDGREVYIADYLSIKPEMTVDEAMRMLKRFEQDYASALSKNNGTLIIDTSTQLWQLVSKVFLDEIKQKRRDGQIYPFDYANANAYFQNLINQVKPTEMNMVLVQRAKEKYNDKGNASGNYEQQGNNQVPYLVGTELMAFKEGSGDTTKYGVEVVTCWYSSKVDGLIIPDPDYTKVRHSVRESKTDS